MTEGLAEERRRKGIIRAEPLFHHFVWEPRGKAWTDDIVLEVCKKCNLIHCVDPYARKPVTKNTAYFRLHGVPPGDKMYYYEYTEEDLKKLIVMCKPFNIVYCFFNNMYMYQNALQFRSMKPKHSSNFSVK